MIEGCHIRCGLINDLELFDDNPSNYIDDAKRHHRWTRGDWQIISWLGSKVRNEKGERVKNQVNTIGRWKIFDNLRRSVLSLAVMVLLLFGFGNYLATGGTSASPAWFVLAALIVVASPIVFFGKDFWQKTVPLYPFLQRLMESGYYKDLLLSIYDDPEDIVRRAWRDLKRGKDVSKYGFKARVQAGLCKILPHKLVMSVWMKQQKL